MVVYKLSSMYISVNSVTHYWNNDSLMRHNDTLLNICIIAVLMCHNVLNKCYHSLYLFRPTGQVLIDRYPTLPIQQIRSSPKSLAKIVRLPYILDLAQSAGAVEYTDCTSAEE